MFIVHLGQGTQSQYVYNRRRLPYALILTSPLVNKNSIDTPGSYVIVSKSHPEVGIVLNPEYSIGGL
jgi:hypothetical protein